VAIHLRVLHVIAGFDPRRGGPTTALLGMAAAQATAGLTVTIIGTHDFPASPLPEIERLRRCGVKVAILRSGHRLSQNITRFNLQLSQSVRDCDIVHIHGLWDAEPHLAARAAQQLGKPFIFRPCGMLAPWSLRQGFLKKQLYLKLRLRRHLKRAAAMHFTTSRERDASAQLGLATPAIVEPNGIDLAEFNVPASAQGLPAQFSELGGKPFVLFLGRIHPKKGLPLLVKALARLKHQSAMLMIAGPDDVGHAKDVEAIGRDLGVNERIKFVGPLAGVDRVAAFRNANVFALTSYHENFGNSVLESLACGTPVVISDHVDFCEEIAGSNLGSVVPLEPERIASAIDLWFDDTRRRDAVRVSGPSFVQKRFSWADIAARWCEHYRRLAGAPRTMTVTALPTAN
jgi:glycosyltransferase involved in cell wall biosynthesis